MSPSTNTSAIKKIMKYGFDVFIILGSVMSVIENWGHRAFPWVPATVSKGSMIKSRRWNDDITAAVDISSGTMRTACDLGQIGKEIVGQPFKTLYFDPFSSGTVGIWLEYQQHLKMTVVTFETLSTKRGSVVHFSPSHTFAPSFTHTMFIAQKNNFLVISTLLWVAINFSSFHDASRVWAQKFDLL